MPKLSVIIPVYRVEQYIERCARSLFEQTLDDIEYLFIDDCTPDMSIEILKKVLEEYPNRKEQVIIHRMNQNSGQAAVRKWGMQNASGEFFIHCDSDDWVNAEMYQSMYEKAIITNADMVVCEYVETDGNNIIKHCKSHIGNDWDSYFEELLHNNVSWALWNKMIKSTHKSSIIEYPKGNMGEDMAYVLQMMHTTRNIIFIDEPYYNYFVNDSSITNTSNEQKVLSNFYNVNDNLRIVLRKWQGCEEELKHKKGFDFLKYHAKYIIKPLIYKREYKEIWENTFPYIEKSIIIDKNVPIILKLRSIFVICRLYQLLCVIKKKLS